MATFVTSVLSHPAHRVDDDPADPMNVDHNDDDVTHPGNQDGLYKFLAASPFASLPLFGPSGFLHRQPLGSPEEEVFSAYLEGLRITPNNPALMAKLRGFLLGEVEKQLRATRAEPPQQQQQQQQGSKQRINNNIGALLDQRLQRLKPALDKQLPCLALEVRYGGFMSQQHEVVTQQHQQLQRYLNRQAGATTTPTPPAARRSSNPFAVMFSLVRRRSSDKGKEKEKDKERATESSSGASAGGVSSPRSESPPRAQSHPASSSSSSVDSSPPPSQIDFSSEKHFEMVVGSPFAHLQPSELCELFTCPACLCLLNMPVTASCGHTYCMGCLRNTVKDCHLCGRGVVTAPEATFVNITLYKVLETYFPAHVLGLASLKAALEENSRGNLQRSLELVSVAIDQNPACQLLYVHRSQWNLALGKVEGAVKDALAAVSLQPSNGFGQLCLAEIYLRLNKLADGIRFACQALLWNPRLPQAQHVLDQALSSAISSAAGPSLSEILGSPIHLTIYDLEPPQGQLEVSPSLHDDESDFECQVCFNTFLDPVTTQCGHSFCRSCLLKAIESNGRCPYCRFSLSRQRHYRKKNYDRILAITSSRHYSITHAERLQALITAELEECLNIPIFVCTLGFPQVRCPLNIFEPRYKLMVERVVTSGRRQFGMCGHNSGSPYYEYGTMMEIRNSKPTPEGNILLDTCGIRRFRVKNRRMLDGYNIADIEYVEDDDTYEIDETGEIQEMMKKATRYVAVLRGSYSAKMLTRFDTLYGSAPLDPSDFSLWLLAFLPIEDTQKYLLLSSTDCINRLRQLTQLAETALNQAR